MWCHSCHETNENKMTQNQKYVTISGPQAEPSAAGINLVSHFLPTRWHHRALQISWNNIKERELVGFVTLLTCFCASNLRRSMISISLSVAANKMMEKDDTLWQCFATRELFIHDGKLLEYRQSDYALASYMCSATLYLNIYSSGAEVTFWQWKFTNFVPPFWGVIPHTV